MAAQNDFNTEAPVFRVRCGGTNLKARYARIAAARGGGDPTAVAREALFAWARPEEKRLGLSPLADKPKRERKKKAGTADA